MTVVILNSLIVLIFSFFLFLVIWNLLFNLKGEIKLKLRLFKQIYCINPSKWQYRKVYRLDDLKNLFYEEHQIKLSFPAFLWFLFYRITSNYRKTKAKERKLLALILEDCQEDIDKLKKKAEEDIEKALKQQEKILKGWKCYGLDN